MQNASHVREGSGGYLLLIKFMKKLTFFLSLLVFCLVPQSFADVSCYNSCEEGGYADSFVDGTVCGVDIAVDFPLSDQPSCFDFAVPSCSSEYPMMCSNSDACSSLGAGYWWFFGTCFSASDGFPADYDNEIDSTNEQTNRLEVLVSVHMAFVRFCRFYFPVFCALIFLQTIFLFILLFKKRS